MAASLVSSFLALALTLCIVLFGRPLRGTTLVGPWLWGIVSGSLLTLAQLAAALPEVTAGVQLADLLPYAADVSTLCPLVALLGARRPQHTAWQFVVATLFVILLVPAVQGGISNGRAEIEAPWSWFLLGLAAMGLVNAMPTRYWPAAVATALAQLILLSPHLFPTQAPGWLSSPSRVITALALLIAAVVFMRWRAVAIRSKPQWQARDPLDRLWLDFRDAYGVLWGMRVQQRVNAAAVHYDWPVALAWDGFRDRVRGEPLSAIPVPLRAPIEQVLRTLLWRFMSEQWIEESFHNTASGGR